MTTFQGLTTHDRRVPAEPFHVKTDGGVHIHGTRLGLLGLARRDGGDVTVSP